MKIQCRTTFDITETGVTGQCRPQRLPFVDRANTHIVDEQSWNKSRNQQRNLETISQVLQLRTQLFNVTVPVVTNGYWAFEFEVEFEGIYQLNMDTFGILKKDCEGVPMLIGLNEQYTLTPMLVTDGSQQNIWFDTISVNN